MKICIIAQAEPAPDIGGGKAQYYLSQAWRDEGVELDIFSNRELRRRGREEGWWHGDESQLGGIGLLNAFLEHTDVPYDIIDYDHKTALIAPPPARWIRTLFVARSVLFAPHFDRIEVPCKRGLASKLKSRFFSPKNSSRLKAHVRIVEGLHHADLINVTSVKDIAAAERMGIPRDKVCRFPYALDEPMIARLNALPRPAAGGDAPELISVGSFDFRKGCYNTAETFHRVLAHFPGARLTLLGAKGLHQTEAEVRAFFNAAANQRLTVHMRFDPDQLPDYLSGKHLALFPSYVEGFPFAVQETLAAGIPTIGFEAPGTVDMLPPEWRVPIGDGDALVESALGLLRADGDRRTENAATARAAVARYNWPDIARETLALYREKLASKRGGAGM